MGTQLLQKKHNPPPNYRPMSVVAKWWTDQDSTWYGGKPWSRWRWVRWGPSFPLKGAQPPPTVFGPCLLWPKAGWMKTPLGTEEDLGPGHIVLDVDPAPLPAEWHSSPIRPRFFLADVYCGHGRPSQLLLSSCYCRVWCVLSGVLCTASVCVCVCDSR